MLFPFIQYINPAWYFNLSVKVDIPYFPDYDLLEEADKSLIQLDEGYSCRAVAKLDATYQAWQRGFILKNSSQQLVSETITPITSDNYRFIKRYFHPLWSWYILFLRILTFHNPVKEISAFISQFSTRRFGLHKKVYPHDSGFLKFDSPLLRSAPKVSIIIPTLNRYKWLKDALQDLELQDYQNFDIIVVDQSDPVEQAFYQKFKLDIKVIRQVEKALWLARNTAVTISDAEYLLLYDDDSRTKPDWITQHIKCLDYFQADISSGISISVIGAKVPENYSFFRWGDQLDTGNAMIKREVFRRIGLFDRQFEGQRMGDGEFGLRAYLAGFKNISNPYAKRIHLKVREGGLRQMGSWDSFRPIGWFAPRPVPSVLYLLRKYFGNKAAFYSLLTDVPRSILPYRYKRNNRLLLLGSFLVIPLLPVLIGQVIKSWRIATVMLREGNKIQILKG